VATRGLPSVFLHLRSRTGRRGLSSLGDHRGKGVRPECLRRIFEKAARHVTDAYERRDAEEGKRRGHSPSGPSEV
jgi:hypothetical protein